MIVTYKGNEYKIITICEMKDINSGKWVESVLYMPTKGLSNIAPKLLDIPHTPVYVRELGDFVNKFTPSKETIQRISEANLVYMAIGDDFCDRILDRAIIDGKFEKWGDIKQ